MGMMNMQGMMGMPGMNMNQMNMQGMMGMPGMNMNQMNMQRMGMGGIMNTPLMNMNQMNMSGMNIGGLPNNEDWLKGYSKQTNETNSVSANKLNIVFKSTAGVQTIIPIEQGKTMAEIIKIYFTRMGKPELYNKKEDICFLFNAKKIPFDCQEKVEDFFNFGSTPTIIVNDVKGLIGA